MVPGVRIHYRSWIANRIFPVVCDKLQVGPCFAIVETPLQHDVNIPCVTLPAN